MNDARRRPEWLRKVNEIDAGVVRRMAGIAHLGLSTVCQSARCPNLSECFSRGSATFLILGRKCTRSCVFCAVEHGAPEPTDPEEGNHIAVYMGRVGVRYAVITSVTRDDLPDGGAGHFAAVAMAVKRALPSIGLELLVPDFLGDTDAVDTIMELPIEVFGHNMETVLSLYKSVRNGADYDRSLGVLARAASRGGGRISVKSGVMVGLGETVEELSTLFRDLADAGVRMLTIGQYLRPRRDNIAVARFLSPEEFDRLAESARSCGIANVVSGPYVRSSYLAETMSRGVEHREKGLTKGVPGNIIRTDS
jgi:lipoic acid synthetase